MKHAATPARIVTITPPNFQVAAFKITGTAPLVIHRMSAKLKFEMLQRQTTGGVSSRGKKVREAQDPEAIFNLARYRSSQGWDGFHAGAIRNAMISACRVAKFHMSLAKLSIFVEADGWDASEPQIPLIRIEGEAAMQQDLARVETGQPYVTIRAAYYNWKATVRIRWDADQFSITDISNLLSRVGLQVGIGEGRPDSKKSSGLGWGLFALEQK